MDKSPRLRRVPSWVTGRLAQVQQKYPCCNATVLSALGVLAFLAFALIKLPMEMKDYAWRSAHTFGRGGGSGLPASIRYGGFVDLATIKEVPVNHRDSGAVKQVIISRGQIPHLMGFSRAVVRPGQSVPPHHHRTKDEVFHVTSGEGVFYLAGEELHIGVGTTVHVAAGQDHRIDNVSTDQDLVLLYFGIDTAQ
eukprot:TRINITY_DN3653_c0_g1_i1.p2 TRINITY_DN3653_c0_g1~~TRINITY_DN3653_c0_g1_i1.p2  ORF type:complete len:194 (-),score=23.74 TRINITY_DN3653_c0_g1_i1:261-842(-)